MEYKQKKLGSGLYEYRDYEIKKTKILLNKAEMWAFADKSGTTYTAKTLKKCKEWIDSIQDNLNQ